jgi:hypothetical protein
MNSKKFFISFFVLQIAMFILGVLCVVYILINAMRNDTLLENVMPLIYLALHFAILAFGIIMTFKAIKHGSLIFNTLCFDESGYDIIGPKITSGIFGTIGLGLFIYFLLVFSGVPIPGHQFSIGLIVDLSYVGLCLFILCLYFFIYPFMFEYQSKQINKE